MRTGAMLQRETIEPVAGKTTMPWASRLALSNEHDAHPHTLEEFAAWPDLDRIGRLHLAYLEAVSAALRDVQTDDYKQIFAIGPFVGRKRKYTTIPLLFITSKADLSINLYEISERLADPYLDYTILPDIHLLSEAGQQSLERAEDEQWEDTMRASIRLLRS